MTTVALSPVFNGQQFFDNTGKPLAGGKIFTYQAGSTSVLRSTFTTSAGNVENANPIILNSSGRAVNEIWLDVLATYNLVLTDSSGTTVIETVNDVAAIKAGGQNLPAAIHENLFIATAGQTAFGLSTAFAVGTNRISVFRNGARLYNTRDYVETSSTVITLNVPAEAGDEILISEGTLIITTTGVDSSEVGYTPAGTSAIGTNVQTKLRESVSVKDFGAKGDGVTDDTAAIQSAINSSQPLFFPTGTYLLRLSQTIALEGGNSVCSLIANTGMVLRGAGAGKTIFKLKDNESTDASPKYFNIIAGNTIIDGLLIEGITFDINGTNNKISPNRGSNSYNNFNCAALMISGSTLTSGIDARLTNSKILNCEVINSPGSTCIGLAQTNKNSTGGGSGSILGNNIEIAGCRFYNNGLDSNDHSSIYMWANNVKVHHCTFDHPSASSGVQGPLAAGELHGSQNWFTDNTIQNYPWGIYVAGNFTSLARGQFIMNNNFSVSNKSIIFFNETASEPGMADINIDGNIIYLIELFSGGPAKKCIDIVPSQGNVDGVSITNNIIYTSDTYGAYAISIGALAVGRAILNVQISNNLIKNFSTPIQVGLGGSTGSVFQCRVSGNQLLDIKPNTSTPTFTIGVYVVGVNGGIIVSNNVMMGAGATANPYFGVYLDAGTIDSLHMEGNDFNQLTTLPISDNITVSGRRSGIQATSFTALPTQSTWKTGDFATNLSIAEVGSSPNKYVIRGWTRLTNGTANVLNTDWVQSRALTGN